VLLGKRAAIVLQRPVDSAAGQHYGSPRVTAPDTARTVGGSRRGGGGAAAPLPPATRTGNYDPDAAYEDNADDSDDYDDDGAHAC
jgi:hypothetical protein